jgi:hypothetical protein
VQGTEAASGARLVAALQATADDGRGDVQWAARAPGAWQRSATPARRLAKALRVRGSCGSKSKAACLEFYDRSRGVPGGGGTPGAAPTFGLCRPTRHRPARARARRERDAIKVDKAATCGTSEAH